jgi:peptidoglycan/xylan/chitin deacetylase (PgdA/CDA1 family)
MGNPLPSGVFDTNARSWGEYGAARGIERLLRVLDVAQVRASVMVSGLLADREPDTVRAVAGAGHEIVAHGFSQDRIPAMLSPDDQRADIERTTTALQRTTGRRPGGWISPRGTPGVGMGRLLVEAGYVWHGDAFDDDRPYVEVHGGRPLVAVPLTMEINDLPHAMRFGRSPQQFVDLFDALLARLLREQDEAVLIDVTAHAHVYGRPAGAWAYGDIARSAAARTDIWVATRGEIAQHALNASRTRERA